MSTHASNSRDLLLVLLFLGFGIIAPPAWGQPEGSLFEDYEFIPDNITPAGYTIGQSVAIDNGIIVAEQYVFDATTGDQIHELIANDGATLTFGISVAIDEDIIAVGDTEDEDFGYRSGTVYLFDLSTGAQTVKLVPSEGAEQDGFGRSVAIDNGIVAVGSPASDRGDGEKTGVVYLFDAASGGQIARIIPEDTNAFAYFGISIAMSNNILAVGAFGDNDNGAWSGAAYLFDVSTGDQIAKLLPDDGAAGDSFGYSIDIGGDTVVVGAMQDADFGFNTGSAYLFNTAGEQTAKLLASDEWKGVYFGASVSIHAGTVAINNIYNTYLFDASSGTETLKLVQSDLTTDSPVNSIAIENATVVAGASTHEHGGNSATRGGMYVFTIPESK